jgi:hypothetical protein
MGSLYVSYGIRAGAEQLQSRTRTCSSATRYTRNYYYGNSGSYQQGTRRERTCNSSTTTTERYYEASISTVCTPFASGCIEVASSTFGVCSPAAPTSCPFTPGSYRTFSRVSGSTWYCFQCNYSQFNSSTCSWVQTGQYINNSCQPRTDACVSGGIKIECSSSTTYSFGAWSNYYDYNGSECSGISSCGAGTVGQVQYQCSSRSVPTCDYILYDTQSGFTTCGSNSVSCSSATTSNPYITCSSYQICSCGSYSDWTDDDTCTTQLGTGICSSEQIKQCRLD